MRYAFILLNKYIVIQKSSYLSTFTRKKLKA